MEPYKFHINDLFARQEGTSPPLTLSFNIFGVSSDIEKRIWDSF